MQIPAQKCCKEHGKWTEHAHTVANTVENTMENERFELKTVAHTVEMAVSSSKMLQIAWKMMRTGNPKKIPQTKKKSPNNFLPLNMGLKPVDFPLNQSIELGNQGFGFKMTASKFIHHYSSFSVWFPQDFWSIPTFRVNRTRHNMVHFTSPMELKPPHRFFCSPFWRLPFGKLT